MARHLLFGRHAYEKPLTKVGEVEADETPTLEQAGVGEDWLELVTFPEAAAIWVLREAELVDQ